MHARFATAFEPYFEGKQWAIPEGGTAFTLSSMTWLPKWRGCGRLAYASGMKLSPGPVGYRYCWSILLGTWSSCSSRLVYDFGRESLFCVDKRLSTRPDCAMCGQHSRSVPNYRCLTLAAVHGRE